MIFARLRKEGSRSLVLPLPKALCLELGLMPGDHVLLAIREDRLLVQKVKPTDILHKSPAPAE